MGVEIRLPNITGTTEREQLLQLKSYLYQLSEQLQWAFDTIDTSGKSGAAYVVSEAPRVLASSGPSSSDAQATFASIKSLIIKSADIVDAYYEEINKRLESVYVAQSDFGAYAEQTALEIEATSKSITQNYENVQVLIQETKQEFGTTIVNTTTELNTTIANTKTELSGTIDSAKTELNSTIEGAKSELNSVISTSVEGAKAEISTVIAGVKDGLIGDIESSAEGIKDELKGTIEGATEELNSSIANTDQNAKDYAEAAEAEAKGYTDDAKSELDDKIGETANELDGKIVDANGRIDETNSALGNLGDGLDSANSRIDGVEDSLASVRTEITNNIQEVANSVSSVDRLLESAKAQLQGSLEDIKFKLEGLSQIVVGVTAYIESGELYYTDEGVPVYGIEIGQRVNSDGTEVFNKFARFTSEKLSFYDANSNEVAYISDKKLYIGQAEITISFKIGGFVDLAMPNGDVVTKWEGVSG